MGGSRFKRSSHAWVSALMNLFTGANVFEPSAVDNTVHLLLVLLGMSYRYLAIRIAGFWRKGLVVPCGYGKALYIGLAVSSFLVLGMLGILAFKCIIWADDKRDVDFGKGRGI